MKTNANSLDSFWSLSKEEIIESLSSSMSGLSSEQAQERIREFGPNTLKSDKGTSLISLFLNQVKNPVTLLLIFASLLSMGVRDTSDAIIILVIILISSLLGFWQEKGAAGAVAELMKLVQIRCRVLRSGESSDQPVEVVVPGDVIQLSAGDMVPADCYLLSSSELFVDEASFTGETFPVEKNVGVVPQDTPIAKRSNVLFLGAHVVSGRAAAMVVRTGRFTEFGKIATSLRSKPPETDFEKGIRHFGYLLMQITLILVISIFAVNILLHRPVLDSFLFSLALAVGLTPQLLPAIISVNLSVGARTMAKQQVIVKRLSSIENFGSMNILCSDKTGTITDGKIKLHETIDVSGNISKKVLDYAWFNATYQQGFKNPIDEAIHLAGYGSGNITVQSELPYDFIRKRLTIQLNLNDENITITKGALNSVLDICTQVEISEGNLVPIDRMRDEILSRYGNFSSTGYRVLGVGYKITSKEKDLTRDDEKGMVFLGFLTFFDPIKADAKATIDRLSNLGIELKVITGDNALIAANIAGQLGFENPVILTGAQIREMSDEAFILQAQKANIFAEVEPNQKQRIIVFLKKSGNVVGFMGDGINDAAALHAADVGISVDSAVDVAKEAADIVLMTPGLNVLITGILAGRKTFANTMKYIFMATSSNFGNMFSMAGASLILPFLPLLPKQVLLTNLMTDFPETTIATDRIDEITISKPHRWDIAFIKRFMITFGILSSVFDLITFFVLLRYFHADEQTFQTGWFTESVISASLIVLVIRTRLSIFKSPPGKYLALSTMIIIVATLALPFTPLQTALGFVRLPFIFYGYIFLIVISYIIMGEIIKQWFYRRWSPLN